MKVSFVIPTYNGKDVLAETLPPFMEWLGLQNWQSEVIVVDDGSIEDSLQDWVQRQGAIFLRLESNQGKGAAVRCGVSRATGDYIVFTDNDIPYDYTDIYKFVQQLHETKNVDVVVGDRGLPESQYFLKVPWIRRFGSWLFTQLVQGMTAAGLQDTQCGLKAFRADVGKKLFAVSRINGFAFDVEVLFICAKWDLRVVRLPVRLRSQKGKSVSMVRHGLQMFWDVFRIRVYDRRGLY